MDGTHVDAKAVLEFGPLPDRPLTTGVRFSHLFVYGVRYDQPEQPGNSPPKLPE